MKNMNLKLYVITDSTGMGDEEFLKRIEGALQGGATILQLREKDKRIFEISGEGTSIDEKVSGASCDRRSFRCGNGN